MEQEIASIISIILNSADNPTPYYNEVKEGFAVPSMFFPTPTIDTDGETFVTYKMHYTLHVMCFHKTTQEAYIMALKTLTAIKAARNCVPLIGEDGKPTGQLLRLDDPEIKEVDSGAYQISVSWDSRRPYKAIDYPRVQDFITNQTKGI